MPSVDITYQPTVVEATNDTLVVSFSETQVTVEVPSPAPVVEFASAATLVPGAGLTGGGYLLGNVPIGLSAASVASLLKADTAIQPGANLSEFVDDVGLATDAEVAAAIAGLGAVYQPVNSNLTAIAGQSTTVFGRSFLDLADAVAARTLIGVYSTSEVLSLLAGKANTNHTHSTADITGGISWSNLTGIPATFPPGAHTHVMTDLTDFVAAGAWGSITGILSAQTDLQAALDAKSAVGHTHSYLPLSGGTLTGQLNVAAEFRVQGASSFIGMEDRTTPAQLYGWYADGGTARFWTQGVADTATVAYGTGVWNFTTTPTVGGTAVSLAGHTHDYAASSHTHTYILSNTSDVTAGFQAWNLDEATPYLNPNTGWHYGWRIGHGSADTYYSVTFAVNFFNDEVYFRRKTGGTNQSWRSLWHTGNLNPDSFVPRSFLNALQLANANSGSDSYGISFNYLQSGAANKPTGTDHALLTMAYSANWYSVQIAGDWRTNTLYTRTQQEGSWGSWVPLSKEGHTHGVGASWQIGPTPTKADNSNDYAVEIYGEMGSANGELALRFHQGNRWWNSIRVRNTGFYFTSGYDGNLANIYASGIVLGDQTGYPYIFKSGDTVRLQTAHGYFLMGSANSSFVHFSTDGKPFYFGNEVYFNGVIRDYATGLTYSRSDHTHLYFPATTPPGSIAAPAGGVNGATHGWTALDGYGAVVPNYPNNEWWVGVFTGGNETRGIQIAGGYGDTHLYFRKGNSGWQPWQRVATLNVSDGYFHPPSWIRMEYGVGLYTYANDYLQNRSGGGWNMRGGQISTNANYLMLQSGDGANRGYLAWTTYGQEIYSYDSQTGIRNFCLGSYGSMTVLGSKNGWAGVRIDSANNAPYLMFNTGSVAGGIYSETDGWRLYFNGTQWEAYGAAMPITNWGNRCVMSRGTAAPSGGSDGDIYYQYT